MGSDRRQFFNQLVNVGALSGLAAMLPSDAFAKVESSILGESPATGVRLPAGNDTARTHTYHAHARVLQADAAHPLPHDLGDQGLIRLPEEGGFRSQFLDGYRSGEGTSFKSAYMQVAGTRSTKVGYGWVTLATAVVTGLNVHNIVTADLVFLQVSTEHPLEGYVPSVTFLGTRFENLRIAGRVVEPVFDLGICGPKPEDDKEYLQDSAFLSRVAQQREQIANLPGLPGWASEEYQDSAPIRQTGKVECSLVTSIENAAPGTSFGHIIEVPGFGRISLAKLTVDRAFHLKMVHAEADQGSGKNKSMTVPSGSSNGTTVP
jgi:hypothetical protein